MDFVSTTGETANRTMGKETAAKTYVVQKLGIEQNSILQARYISAC